MPDLVNNNQNNFSSVTNKPCPSENFESISNTEKSKENEIIQIISHGIGPLLSKFIDIPTNITELSRNVLIIANELSNALEDNQKTITIKLNDEEELMIEEEITGNVILRNKLGQIEILHNINFDELRTNILNDIENNPGIYRITIPREIAIVNKKYPLTQSSIAYLIPRYTPSDYVLLLRNSPSGNYLYLASQNETNQSERLQKRAAKALELIYKADLIEHTDQNCISAKNIVDFSTKESFIEQSNLARNQTSIVDQDVCLPPTAVTIRWITKLDTAHKNNNNPKQKKLLEKLLNIQKDRWLAHEMSLKKTKDSLIKCSKILRKNGLEELADFAYTKNFEKYSLVSKLPINEDKLTLPLLHDNLYGRHFESVLVGNLVKNPPAAVLDTMQLIGSGIAEMITCLPKRNLGKCMRLLIDQIRGSLPFWSENVPGLLPIVNEIPETKTWDEYDEYPWLQLQLQLLELLRNEEKTGFQSICIPYLTVKIYQSFLGCYVRGQNWVSLIEVNYKNEIIPCRGRMKNSRPKGELPATAGITLRHQPAAFSENWMKKPDRPLLYCKPDLEEPTTPIIAALRHGIPFATGISGSTNIMLGITEHLRKNGYDIDHKFALLGTCMFMIYDGGHSLHEALWVANQFAPRLDVEILPRQIFKSYLDPRPFVADYRSFFNLFKNTPTESILNNAVSLAFESTIAQCKKLTKENSIEPNNQGISIERHKSAFNARNFFGKCYG